LLPSSRISPRSQAVFVTGSESFRLSSAAIASGLRFGVAEVSAYHARPSDEVAIVLIHGMALYFAWACLNSSIPRA